MKIDRAEVEEMLAKCESDYIGPHPSNETLAALCRLALEVMDAPVGRIEGRDCKWLSQRDITHLLGEPVRLVRVGEE